METPRAPESSTKVVIEDVCAPKCSLPTLVLDEVGATVPFALFAPVQADGEHQVRNSPKQTPSTVDARLRQQ